MFWSRLLIVSIVAKPVAESTLHFHNTNSQTADRIATVLVWSAALAITAMFCWILGDLLWNGLNRITWSFLLDDPLRSGRDGGIFPVISATLMIVGICLLVAIPLGLGAAIMLSEYTRADHWFARSVRRSLDILAGVPSIVFGLFGNAFFCIYLGMGYSILAGGLTLACMVLPILIRATEEGFRAVPEEYRQAAAALSMSRTGTLTLVLLPLAVPGLVVGLVLGIGRAMAETAALLFTSGYVTRMPESLLDSGRSLSIHIFDLSMNIPGGTGNAYASALILISLLLIINLAASWLSHRWLQRALV